MIWIHDKDGNRCSTEYFGGADAAQVALDSLRGCVNCVNCENCEDCTNCTDTKGCVRCEDCEGCEGSKDCVDCVGCVDYNGWARFRRGYCTVCEGLRGHQGQTAVKEEPK